ncbi:MAG: type I methionyl aminopeptidase, partial [Acidobacteriota bacterium]
MTINDDRDLVGLTRVARVVAEARRAMLAAVAPGVTTADLDAVGREVLDRHGARPAPPTVGFPAATCVSVNDEAAHGIPSGRVLLAGDVVNVDVSAELDGYWADTGASRPVGETTSRRRDLVEGARQANADAVQAARAGRPVRDIGRAAQRCAHRRRLSVLRNLSGHGTGRALWEEPTVSGFDDPSARTTLHEGLVLAVEPFV